MYYHGTTKLASPRVAPPARATQAVESLPPPPSLHPTPFLPPSEGAAGSPEACEVLEPSSQAQLGTRTPAMPGDQDAHEHGGTNERGNEHQNIRCNGAQPFRLLSSILMQCMDACPDSRPSPAPCRTPSATPFLRDVRCVPQCPPWRSRTPNDPGDVVTKHASGHASPLA